MTEVREDSAISAGSRTRLWRRLHGQTSRRALASLERWGLVAVWAVVVACFGLLEGGKYFSGGTFETIFGSHSVLLIVALGVVIPLTAGDFDFSAASNLALSAMEVAVLNAQHGWGVLPAIGVAMGSALLVGMINGAIVAKMGVSSFVVTLGMGTLLLGLVQWISQESYVTGVSPGLTSWTLGHQIGGVSIMFVYGLLLTVAVSYVYQFTPLGRRLVFVGRSATVARLSGLEVTRIRFGAFVTSGAFAGFAGVVYCGSLNGADPASGQSFLLPAFTAAYLGATAIVAGRFNPRGTWIAVYFLASGIAGLQLLGVADFVQQLFYGGALVIAVVLSHLAGKRRKRPNTILPTRAGSAAAQQTQASQGDPAPTT